MPASGRSARLVGQFTTVADEIAAAGLRVALFNSDETYRALGEFDGEVRVAVGDTGAQERFHVPLPEVRALLGGALQIDVVQRDQAIQFNASRPQFAARDITGAERDLLRLVRDGYRVFVAFRHPGEAERATYRLRTVDAEVVTREQLARGGEASAGLYFLAAPLRDGFISADLKLAVLSETSSSARCAARAAPRRQRPADELLRRAPRRLRRA